MGGKPESFDRQGQITSEQLDLMRKSYDAYKEMYGKGMDWLDPMVKRLTGLIGGDNAETMRTAAPAIGRIDTGYTQAKESIFDKIAPGAARDFALAGLERDRATSKAGYLNDIVTQAYSDLGTLGTGFVSGSFQPLGATARFGEGASSSNQSLMQAENQRRQGTLNFFSNLVGAATGGLANFMKPASGGPSGGSGYTATTFGSPGAYNPMSPTVGPYSGGGLPIYDPFSGKFGK